MTDNATGRDETAEEIVRRTVEMLRAAHPLDEQGAGYDPRREAYIVPLVSMGVPIRDRITTLVREAVDAGYLSAKATPLEGAAMRTAAIEAATSAVMAMMSNPDVVVRDEEGENG